jgi:hypothetical protein
LTAWFYAALHLVQAYLVTQGISSDIDHQQRRACIRGDVNLVGIWEDYRDLMEFSHKARYRTDPFLPLEVKDAEDCLNAVEARIKELLH